MSILRAFKFTRCIIYAADQNQLSNVLVRERYDKFNERQGLDAPYMRTSSIDFERFVSVADAIFCIESQISFLCKSLRETSFADIFNYP